MAVTEVGSPVRYGLSLYTSYAYSNKFRNYSGLTKRCFCQIISMMRHGIPSYPAKSRRPWPNYASLGQLAAVQRQIAPPGCEHRRK